ncbi:biotin/lipoyl-containing protein [Terrisporobacter glycolicus]|uniref:Glutaconyl-CoA decarboxylase subunit gamma n=1 Tax=Terrisporobacter glycolicus ATCC 14880 = DSM 1288 TaxID=1121315 RepID=A0ABZ2ERV1_9FIRM|nr:biotin/lipoyl-containing protein [Terrisporobacter glycolicus]
MIKNYNIVVNGNTYEVQVEELGASVESIVRPQDQVISKPTEKQEVAQKKATSDPVRGSGNVLAPMPGTISDVKISEGQNVAKGDILLILEAMKMENEILAPANGTVKEVKAIKGASVSSGDLLVRIG